MGPSEVKIKYSAVDDGFAAATQKEVQQINQISAARDQQARAEQRLAALRKQFIELDRAQRKAEFDRLPIQQQINQLLAREAELKRRLAQPGTARSEQSTLAYQTALKMTQIDLQKRQAVLGNFQSTADIAASRQAEQAALEKRQQLETRLANNSRSMFQIARSDREQAFAALKPKEQLLALEEKRERLIRFVDRAGENEMRRSQLMLSLRKTESSIAQTKATIANQPSLKGDIKNWFASQAGQIFSGAGVLYAFDKIKQKASETIEAASRIKDLSERLGTDTGNAQQLSYAAGKTNLSEEDLGTTFKALRLAQEKGQRGDKDTLEIFTRFGITAQQLRVSRPDELFKQIAINAQNGKAAAAGLTDATEVFGKSADRVLTALSGGFADAMDEIKSGGIIDDKTISQLDDAAKSSKLLGTILTAHFAPGIAAVLDVVTKSIPTFVKMGDGSIFGIYSRFFGALSGGATFDQAADQAGNWSQTGDDMEKAMRVSELRKKAKDDAISFREAQRTKIATAINTESDPVRKAALAAAARQNDRELERLKTNRDPELERQARLEQLKKEVAKIQEEASFERLTKEEKIAYLQKKKAEEAAKINAGSDEEDILTSRIKQAELDKKIASIEGDVGQAPWKSPDALARIGLHVGPLVPMVSETKQLRQAMEKRLDRVNSNLEKLETTFKEIA